MQGTNTGAVKGALHLHGAVLPGQRRGAFSPFRLQARGVQGVSGFPRFPPQGRDAHFRRVQRPVQAFRPLKSGVESGPGTFQHRAAFFRGAG